MQNSLKFSIILCLLFIFSSCEKEYTCVCEGLLSTTTHIIKAKSKSKAIKACDDLDFSSPAGLGFYDIQCSIEE